MRDQLPHKPVEDFQSGWKSWSAQACSGRLHQPGWNLGGVGGVGSAAAVSGAAAAIRRYQALGCLTPAEYVRYIGIDVQRTYRTSTDA